MEQYHGADYSVSTEEKEQKIKWTSERMSDVPTNEAQIGKFGQTNLASIRKNMNYRIDKSLDNFLNSRLEQLIIRQ